MHTPLKGWNITKDETYYGLLDEWTDNDKAGQDWHCTQQLTRVMENNQQ